MRTQRREVQVRPAAPIACPGPRATEARLRTATTTASRALLAGVRDTSPMLLGVVPFGLVAGLAVVEIGLGTVHALGFSIGIFAGAAQLASIDLLGADAHIAVVVGTALVINSRMLMYSASIAPYLAGEPLPRRALASYVLVDQVYALSVIRYQADPDPATRLPYYLGSGAILWVCWQLANLVGVLVGGAIPESVPLGFAVPMTFIALIVPTVTDRPTVAAALTAAAVATAAAPLPANLGMPIGALSGIAVGTVLALRRTA